MPPNLKQPKNQGKSQVIHAPKNRSLSASLCCTTAGRSWTVTSQPVTCPTCLRLMKEMTPL